MSNLVELKAKCPKCRSDEFTIQELWKDHSITWIAKDGKIDLDEGILSEGNPYKVYCSCHKCKHGWTALGVIQIHGLLKQD